MSDHLLFSLVNKGSISEQVYEWACAFIQYNVNFQHKFLDNRPMLLFRMGFSFICTMHKFLAMAFLACKYVAIITHVYITCTKRDGKRKIYFCGVRSQEGGCLHRYTPVYQCVCRDIYTLSVNSVSKWSCTDLHQLSLRTFFSMHCQ